MESELGISAHIIVWDWCAPLLVKTALAKINLHFNL
jgi:hypothetical protein